MDIAAYVRVIEDAWRSYRNRRIFRLLKHSICAAEHSLSSEIIKRVCPREAELLNDPCMQVKVRFRFGGAEFPPKIFFKIFLCNANGKGIKYVSGKRMIRPQSAAARSACNLMGNRTFYNQLTIDTIHHRSFGLTDEVDVTTLKDYMKYSSVLDETPARLGGRDNSWRQLTLEALPRYMMFYDVVDYLYNGTMTPRLHKELPTLLTLPLTQDVQLQHIDIITHYKSSLTAAPTTTATHRSLLTPTAGSDASRRSRKALTRAIKMKTAYQDTSRSTKHTQRESSDLQTIAHSRALCRGRATADGDVSDAEAERLYEWTRELSFEEYAPVSRVDSYH